MEMLPYAAALEREAGSRTSLIKGRLPEERPDTGQWE
jgi:hypothetical protein